MIHKLACSYHSERQTFPLYAWGLAYYRDRFLTETHSEPSVSLLSFYRNRDTLNVPKPSSGMNTTPKFFTESRGTDNSRLNKLLSQLYHEPVVIYCMVYHYTKRAMLARLLANEGPAIYVVHLNRYFVIPP